MSLVIFSDRAVASLFIRKYCTCSLERKEATFIKQEGKEEVLRKTSVGIC
jgi:hypothetical protein